MAKRQDVVKPIVKVSSNQFIGILVILLVPAIYLTVMSVTQIGHMGACVMYALVAAFITVGLLSATGILKTRNYQVGGAAAVFVIVLCLLLGFLDPLPVTIMATLYLDDVPVSNATVHLLEVDITDTKRVLSPANNGQFKYTGIPPTDDYVRLKITISGYQPFTKEVKINRRLTRIHLKRSDLLVVEVLHEPRVKTEDVETTAYGFVDPPAVEASMHTNDGIDGKDKLKAYFGKMRQEINEGHLRIVRQDEIRIEPGTGFSQIAVIDTSKIIESEYTRWPHGLYKAVFEMPELKAAGLKACKLNFVYKETFLDGTGAFAESDEFLYAPESTGIKIVNSTKSDGFVSALLTQTFDFKENFLLRGSFVATTHAPENGQVRDEKPVGLDISFGNRYKDLISVILADGYWNAYSIKTAKDVKLIHQAGRPDEKHPINWKKNSSFSLCHDGVTENYFEIRFSTSEKQPKLMYCSLYVDTSPPHPDREEIEPLFKRLLPVDQLQEGVTRIRIKLWKAGEAVLRELEVAELECTKSTAKAMFWAHSSDKRT